MCSFCTTSQLAGLHFLHESSVTGVVCSQIQQTHVDACWCMVSNDDKSCSRWYDYTEVVRMAFQVAQYVNGCVQEGMGGGHRVWV